MNAYQEIENLSETIRRYSNHPAISNALDEILLKCRGYMEPDLNSEGKALGLRMSQAAIFDLLLARRGQIVSRNAMLDVSAHYAISEPEPGIADVHICRLRKKLIGTKYENMIEVVYGAGYRMKPEAKVTRLKAAA